MLRPENYHVLLSPCAFQMDWRTHISLYLKIIIRKFSSLSWTKSILVKSLCLIIVCGSGSWISAANHLVFENFSDFNHFLFWLLNGRCPLNNSHTLTPLDLYYFFAIGIPSLVIQGESWWWNDAAGVHGLRRLLLSSSARHSARWWPHINGSVYLSGQEDPVCSNRWWLWIIAVSWVIL